jgi:hypothetical protein
VVDRCKLASQGTVRESGGDRAGLSGVTARISVEDLASRYLR